MLRGTVWARLRISRRRTASRSCPTCPSSIPNGNGAPVRGHDRHRDDPVRLHDHGQDPVLRAAGRHDRHDVLPAAPDAEGEPSGRGQQSAAGHPQVHADPVRDLRLHVPGRTDAVLDHLEPVADRAAVRAAPCRPHRPRRDGSPDRRATGEEREQAREAGVHGADAGARGAGADRRAAASPPRSPAGGNHREAPRSDRQGAAAEGAEAQHRRDAEGRDTQRRDAEGRHGRQHAQAGPTSEHRSAEA